MTTPPPMDNPNSVTTRHSTLVLSLFPGLDLMGQGFEADGYCIVRGPDLLWGGDVRRFFPPRGVFTGIIGGSPCQDFSRLRRVPPTGYGLEMVAHFQRCVTEAQPVWFLLENVPGVPVVVVDGYTVQRLHIRASEFGAAQHRLRVFQFGHRDGLPLILRRPITIPTATAPAATATEGRNGQRRGWSEFCALQGLSPAPDLSALTMEARYRGVGNGVDLRVARAVATAIRHRCVTAGRPCSCGCGEPLPPGRTFATAACRKRGQRQRDAAGVNGSRTVTSGVSPVA